MTIDVVMPKMGESVQEGKIIKWHKKPGDQVKRDDVLCDIATDKVDTEVPSAEEGTLAEILVKEGETVAVDTPIARISTDGAGTPARAQETPAATQPATAQPAPKAETTSTASVPQPAQATAPTESAASSSGSGRVEIVMPKMGESVQEGKIIKWVKKQGDKVEKDETLVEISTDKVDTEIPSPEAGVLQEIIAQTGDVVEVGKVLAYLATNSTTTASNVAKTQLAPSIQPAVNTNQNNGAKVSAPAVETQAVTTPVAGSTPPQRMSGKRFYSPLVRTIATQEKVSLEELDSIAGTGIEGRVTKSDLLAYLKNRTARPAASPAAAPTQTAKSEPQKTPPVFAPGEDVEVVEMDYVRQLISEHMVRSKRTSAHVTAVHECDVTIIEKFRAAKKDAFKAREGVSLTPTPFFIQAVAQALRDFPYVNASVDGTKIYLKKHINIGVATALPDGNLIVPVLRDADGMTITGIARALADLANRARTKKLKPDEIQGGTFTITNYGIFGSLFGAPIINQPQVAILGTGAIQKRPVVRELDGTDYIIIRSMCYLSLSHDHRLVDGMLGGKFMSRIVQLLESFDPTAAGI